MPKIHSAALRKYELLMWFGFKKKKESIRDLLRLFCEEE